MIHDRTPDCHPVFRAWMRLQTTQLNVALIHKLRDSFICLAYFLTFYPCVFAEQGTEFNVCTVAPFTPSLDSHSGDGEVALQGCIVNCEGLSVVPLQLKGHMGLFAKRSEFLPGSGFLSHRDMT